MPLNTVQTRFLNEAYRQFVEKFTKAMKGLDDFVLAYNDLQASPNALPVNSTTLDDAGNAPRDDAPTITGNDVKLLHDTLADLSVAVADADKMSIRGKAVRPYTSIVRD